MPSNRDHFRSRPPGFSLTEIIVVMGIITLLIGLLLPAVHYALKYGRKARVQADMQALNIGLEAYKTDFGDYPRFANNAQESASQWDFSSQRGAELLCRALVGPGPAVSSLGPPALSPDNTGADGADGPGFRTRLSVDSNGHFIAQGKVWGPYVPTEKFRIVSLSTIPTSSVTTVIGSQTNPGTIDATAVMLDNENHVILYFPANTTSPNINASGGFIINAQPTAAPSSPVPLYNFWDNATVPSDPTSNTPLGPPSNTPSWYSDFCKLLGADPATGNLSGQTPSFTGPYILWMAGDDAMYGLDSKPNVGTGDYTGTGRSDDVTNFDIPAGLRR